MPRIYCILIGIAVFLLSVQVKGQKVGLVLSGGGASGVAHIGVIKALEENGIPIDYITGTSMGALVGGLYAAGYSPQEIEAVFTSEEILKWTEGILDDRYKYYLRRKEQNAGWVTFKLDLDTVLENSLPTNVVSPSAIDYGMMTTFSRASAVADYDFDKLFVPFRCLASDIQERKSITFKDGNLSTAVRASISYPFFIKPISVNGKLLFDGGLYDNFPSETMCEDFNPDFVVGSNVSYNFPPPSEDDLLSQIKTIIVASSDYDIKCERGVVIEPETKGFPTFEFKRNKELIDVGYKAAQAYIDSIRKAFPEMKTVANIGERRKAFRARYPSLVFDDVFVTGLSKSQIPYIFNSLGFKKDSVTEKKLKEEFVKLVSDDKIEDIYPRSVYDKETGRFDLLLDIDREKDLFVTFGGNFSSRPINEGFIGLQYNYLGKTAITLNANSYFGKYYSSGLAQGRLDFAWKIPFYLSTRFTINKWDYFKSSSAFFEDVKPSFLVIGDNYVESKLGFPMGNKGKLDVGGTIATLRYTYYQTNDFLQTDTADFTEFTGNSFFIGYESNSLNLKQYAHEGTKLKVQARYTLGEEYTQPGSTALDKNVVIENWNWYRIGGQFEHYFNHGRKYQIGLFAEVVWSDQPFFSNYTASILAAPAFQPIPETRTLFQEAFRAHSYGGFGVRNIFLPKKNLQLRLEGYVYQPYQKILPSVGSDKAGYGAAFNVQHYIGSLTAAYTTPVGPVAINVNYYHNDPEPFSILFHFGYILFNKAALD